MQALDISQSRASLWFDRSPRCGFPQAEERGTPALYSIDKEGMANYQLKIIEAVKEALGNMKLTALDIKIGSRLPREGTQAMQLVYRSASHNRPAKTYVGKQQYEN